MPTHSDSEEKPPVAARRPDAREAKQILTTYRRVLESTFISTLLIVAVIAAGLYGLYLFNKSSAGTPEIDPPFLLTVVACGALGALFSSLTRLYGFKDAPSAFLLSTTTDINHRHLIIYSLTPPVVGCIAAAVIYMVFASGLGSIVLSGKITPSFVCKNPSKICDSFMKLADNWSPAEAVDYSKALLWGFIAGFTERLIPDVLGKLGTIKDNK